MKTKPLRFFGLESRSGGKSLLYQKEHQAEQHGHTGEVASEAHEPEADSPLEERDSQEGQREEGVAQDQDHRAEEDQGVGSAGEGPLEQP